MKRIRTFSLVALSLVFLSMSVFGAEQTNAPPRRALPHYFPDGIETVSAPGQEWKQWEAYLRYLNATGLCTSPQKDSMPASFEGSVQVEKVIAGKKTKLIFDPYVRTGNKIIFYDFCGQHYITEEQLKVVIDDFAYQIDWAADEVYNYHRELEADAVKLKAERAGVSVAEMRKQLDSHLPELPQATFRDLEQIPRPMTKADFVPSEVHLGYGPGYLGATWLNTGVVYITLQARIVDQLVGKPIVMIHEFVHGNSQLQNFPFSEGVDVEFMASIFEMLLPDDKISLMFHGYLREMREMIWVFFGYNFDQARKEVIVFDHDGHNLRIDPKKFNENLAKLEGVKKELSEFFRTKALPEFYSNQIFWTSMHEKLQDKVGIFRIMMALNYDPTILGDHEKTTVWLEAHKEEIKEMAHIAFEASDKLQESGEMSMDGDEKSGGRIPSLAMVELVKHATGLSETELLRLAEKYHITENDLRTKSFGELMELYKKIMNTERERKGGVQ